MATLFYCDSNHVEWNTSTLRVDGLPESLLSSYPRGVDMIQFIFHHVQSYEMHESHIGLLRFLEEVLQACCAPFMTLLSKWLYLGAVTDADDPYDEFQLLQTSLDLKDEGRDLEKLPLFLQNETGKAVLYTGWIISLLRSSSPEMYACCTLDQLPTPLSLYGNACEKEEGLWKQCDTRLQLYMELQVEKNRLVQHNKIVMQAACRRREHLRMQTFMDLENKIKRKEKELKEYNMSVLQNQIQSEATFRKEAASQKMQQIEVERKLNIQKTKEDAKIVEKAKNMMLSKYGNLMDDLNTKQVYYHWKMSRVQRMRTTRDKLTSLLDTDQEEWKSRTPINDDLLKTQEERKDDAVLTSSLVEQELTNDTSMVTSKNVSDNTLEKKEISCDNEEDKCSEEEIYFSADEEDGKDECTLAVDSPPTSNVDTIPLSNAEELIDEKLVDEELVVEEQVVEELLVEEDALATRIPESIDTSVINKEVLVSSIDTIDTNQKPIIEAEEFQIIPKMGPLLSHENTKDNTDRSSSSIEIEAEPVPEYQPLESYWTKALEQYAFCCGKNTVICCFSIFINSF